MIEQVDIRPNGGSCRRPGRDRRTDVTRYMGLMVALLAVALLLPTGCQVTSGGGAVLPADDPDAGGGAGAGGGGGGTDDPIPTDGGSSDDDNGGAGSAADTGGLDPGDGGAAQGALASVVLFIDDTNPRPQQFITLTCSVADDGGLPVTSYSFSDSTGSAGITQTGDSFATALVPVGFFTLTYTCNATNQAGTGPDSPPVLVTVTDG